MCVCEEGLKDKKKPLLGLFPHFTLRPLRLIYFMQICFSFIYFFYIFIHLHSLFCVLSICLVEFSVTGYWFLIFLLCLFSGSQMCSDEVTKSAKSGTEKLSLALQMEVVFSGLFFLFSLTLRCQRGAAGAVRAWKQWWRSACWLYWETFIHF